MRTEDALGLELGAEGEAPGFEVGGLWVREPYPAPDSPVAPVDLWPTGTEVTLWRMHGRGWVAPLWRMRMREWLAPGAWRGLVQATLEEMTSHGAQIAWLMPDLEFSDPPSLFKGERIAAAISGPTGFVCRTALGEEVAWLPEGTRRRLHSEEVRLIDPRLPDPDDPEDADAR